MCARRNFKAIQQLFSLEPARRSGFHPFLSRARHASSFFLASATSRTSSDLVKTSICQFFHQRPQVEQLDCKKNKMSSVGLISSYDVLEKASCSIRYAAKVVRETTRRASPKSHSGRQQFEGNKAEQPQVTSSSSSSCCIQFPHAVSV